MNVFQALETAGRIFKSKKAQFHTWMDYIEIDPDDTVTQEEKAQLIESGFINHKNSFYLPNE